jgi:uncharacterized protein
MTQSDLTIMRAYAAELELADGRTIVGRCLPYGEPAQVCDQLPDGTVSAPYFEVVKAGACKAICRAPGRVLLNYEHRGGLLDQAGSCVDLTERDDGLWSTFRALSSPSGDQALELIRSGAVTGLSVEAIATAAGSRRLPDGTVERHRLKQLRHVALVAQPAYAGAGVTALRSAVEVEQPTIRQVRARQAELRLRFAPDS